MVDYDSKVPGVCTDVLRHGSSSWCFHAEDSLSVKHLGGSGGAGADARSSGPFGY